MMSNCVCAGERGHLQLCECVEPDVLPGGDSRPASTERGGGPPEVVVRAVLCHQRLLHPLHGVAPVGLQAAIKPLIPTNLSSLIPTYPYSLFPTYPSSRYAQHYMLFMKHSGHVVRMRGRGRGRRHLLLPPRFFLVFSFVFFFHLFLRFRFSAGRGH